MNGGRTAIVIGAGVGGLAAAIQLARAGLRVRLLERGATVGGKLREVTIGPHKLPGGPSVFTMRWVFEELFGGPLEAHLPLAPLETLCRHFFADRSMLDLFTDEERSREAIAAFAGPKDAEGYVKFRRHASRIFEVVRGPFMENPIPPWSEFLKPRILVQMPRIDALRSLWDALGSFFKDPRLRQLFGRYATYNGSSPYHAPATLAVIAHVENAGGIFALRGGIYRLAEALLAHARALGVEIETGADVSAVLVEGPAGRQRATGVRLGEGRVERADVVVANCDVAHLYERLLPGSLEARGEKYADQELSLSAFLLLAAAPRAPLDLAHHDVFFSGDYEREFEELVDRRQPPSDPTVYLCADHRGEGAEVSGDGTEPLYFLANAPARQGRGEDVDWEAEGQRARARIVEVLARHGWELRPTAETLVTPSEFARLFPSSRGALYGLASNSKMAAFKRPPNRVPGVERLYAVGGTVHPGAGLPMVALSARIAARLIREDLGL